jgi:uncharacterized damage-inducible protein DinB
MLVGYLSWQRSELLNICAGLDAEQLARRALPPSRLSLLGLVRHLAKVERVWFRQRAGQHDVAPLYGGPGDPSDFEDLDAANAEAAVDALQMEWMHSDTAVADTPLTQKFEWRDQTWSLRMVYLHVIGEYARHNGHADLLREAIDGVTGR